MDFFDRRLPHTIVVGMSRSDKSMLVSRLIQEALPLGGSVCILGCRAAYESVCEVYKGECVAIGPDRPLCLNPFAGDLGLGHRSFLAALVDQMASSVSGQDVGRLGQIEKTVCSQALHAFAEWHAENRPGKEPMLRDFHGLLRNAAFEDEGIGKGIALRISQYVGKGGCTPASWMGRTPWR